MSTEPVEAGGSIAARLRGPTQRKLGWNPALDGVRGVSIVFVMVFHFISSPYLAGAPVAVDLFFVMSGFLITTLLLEERAQHGAVSLRDFYLRRAYRLFPAVYTLLGVFLVVALLFGGEHRGRLLAEFFAAAFYVYDVLIAWVGVDGQILVQLWTLSLEEQFYFVWPLLLMAGLRAGRNRLPVLFAAMGAVVVVMPVLRMTLEPELGARTFESFVFGFSIMRPDSLVLGCFAAILYRLEPTLHWPALERWLPIGGWIALGLFACSVLLGGFTPFAPFVSPFYNLTVLLLSLWLLDVVRRPHTRVATALTHPLIRWFGKRSYGLYIWHLLVYFPIQAFFDDVFAGRARLANVAAFPFAFAGTVGVAMLSWRFVETPALRAKERFART